MRVRDSLPPVPGEYLALCRRPQAAARNLAPSPPGRARSGRPQSPGLQLPHDPLPRSGQPGALSQARAVTIPPASNCSRACSCMEKQQGRPCAWAKSSPSARSPTRRPTSTTTARSPRTTSARAGTIPNAGYQRARRKSGAITKSTPRSSSGSWRTTRACRRRCRKRSTNGVWPRTSSPTTATCPTSSTSARRAA